MERNGAIAQRKDRTDSRELEADRARLQIIHTCGVGTHIARQVTATDADNKVATSGLEVKLVNAQGRPGLSLRIGRSPSAESV